MALPPGYSLICSVGNNEQSDLRRDTVLFTIKSIACISLLFVGIFKMVQGRVYAPYLWMELKTTNYLMMAAMTGGLIMF